MKKFFKIFGIIMAVILVGVLIFAIINIKSILLVFGVGKLNVKDYNTAVTSLEKSDAFQNVETSTENGQEVITCSSTDGVVNYVIKGNEGEKITQVEAEIDAKKLKDIDYTNVNVLTEQAKEYISPIVSDDQVLGLTGFVAKQALEQFNQGKTQIVIEQNFDGIYVTVNGDTSTGQFTISMDTNPK